MYNIVYLKKSIPDSWMNLIQNNVTKYKGVICTKSNLKWNGTIIFIVEEQKTKATFIRDNIYIYIHSFAVIKGMLCT